MDAFEVFAPLCTYGIYISCIFGTVALTLLLIKKSPEAQRANASLAFVGFGMGLVFTIMNMIILYFHVSQGAI